MYARAQHKVTNCNSSKENEVKKKDKALGESEWKVSTSGTAAAAVTTEFAVVAVEVTAVVKIRRTFRLEKLILLLLLRTSAIVRVCVNEGLHLLLLLLFLLLLLLLLPLVCAFHERVTEWVRKNEYKCISVSCLQVTPKMSVS